MEKTTRAGAIGLAGMLMLTAALGLVRGARADEAPDPGRETTPPRLSLTDGQVSFWRPGAPEWTQAQVNTPLAPGDALSTGSPGTLEIQIGARAFVRAWGNTQLGLGVLEPDFVQLTLAAGSAVLDLRGLDPGETVEIDTPNAAVMIGQPGYYRVDVTGDRSRIMTREGGRATVTPAGGQAVTVTPSEELVVEGTSSAQLAAYAAPPLDDWDRWNYSRTDRLLDAVSARYVTPGTYGLSDLDPYGTWRVVPSYGTVWVPTGVAAGWTPYSTGSWISDPVYGWTWVDTAPWGWAPYHYGRWSYVDGYWAWAPGPIIARPVYAPALVAFLGDPGVVVGAAGAPVGWVPLGWGEPVVPWWRRGHGPSWRGWGGPRVVNNVVVTHATVVNVQNITVYRNASVPRAVVAVDRARFGHGPITGRRIAHVDGQRLRPLPGAPQIAATPSSLVPSTTRGIRPPEATVKRLELEPERARRGRDAVREAKPEPQVGEPLPRPRFGRGPTERPMADRKAEPAPPRVQAGPVANPSAPRPPAESVTRTAPVPRPEIGSAAVGVAVRPIADRRVASRGPHARSPTRGASCGASGPARLVASGPPGGAARDDAGVEPGDPGAAGRAAVAARVRSGGARHDPEGAGRSGVTVGDRLLRRPAARAGDTPRRRAAPRAALCPASPPIAWLQAGARAARRVPTIPRVSRSRSARRDGRESLGREPERLRELAGEGLVADDERQLDDLRVREVLPEARAAPVGDLEVVPRDPLAEFERGALASREVRALPVPAEVGERLRGYPTPHADGVADVHSVGHAVERRHLEVEQGAEPRVDRPQPLDGAVERTHPEHEGQPVGHEPLRGRHLAEHPRADPEEDSRRDTRALVRLDPRHRQPPSPTRSSADRRFSGA